MTFTSLLSRPVVLVKRTRTPDDDSYGGDTLVDGTRIDLLAVVHQRTTVEELVGQDTTGTGWTAMLDADAPVERDDVLEVDGVRFQIDGEPYRPWNYRLGHAHHLELSLIESHG